MKRAAMTALALAVSWSGIARADEPRAEAPSRERAADTTVPTKLDLDARAGLLIGGLATFGAAYWPALYVGGTSDLTSDHLMLVPLAGPWLSLAERSPCGGFRAPSCGSDTTSRALIVTDGIVQAIGALLAIGALTVPPSKTQTAAPAASSVHVSLAPTRDGWALAAVARF